MECISLQPGDGPFTIIIPSSAANFPESFWGLHQQRMLISVLLWYNKAMVVNDTNLQTNLTYGEAYAFFSKAFFL